MRFPPIKVPSAIVAEQRSINQNGKESICISSPLPEPTAKDIPKIAIDINFWPSCAPWSPAKITAKTFWTYLQTRLPCLRLTPLKKISMMRTRIQPIIKPATRLKNIP